MNRIKNLPPKKALGQHFLKDAQAIKRIVDTLPVHSHLLEIGPGTGALTEQLLEKCARLVLVEKDDQLASHWKQRAALEPRLVLIHADIMQVVDEVVKEFGPQWIIGNLPYNISGPLTAKLAGLKPFQGMVLMYQREVAERLLAGPGNRVYGGLSVLVRHHYDVRRLLSLPPGAFSPLPRVHSTVLVFRAHGVKPACPYSELQKTVRHGFAHRRKTIANNFRDLIHPKEWKELEINPMARPEELDYSRWVRIAVFLMAKQRT